MTTPKLPNPFHSGELEAQSRAGAGDVAQWAGGFIREYLTEQHRTFHTAQPFFVAAGSDTNGDIWTTLIEGRDGFARSPNETQITLSTKLDSTDPLTKSINEGTRIGVLGIELASRRRNRFSGFIRPIPEGYSIDVSQAFGNCPQYIKPRNWVRAERTSSVEAHASTALNDTHKQLIAHSDTMFIGSGQLNGENTTTQGFDASHRGGAPGFVHVVDDTHVHIPDYAGNNFFNTLGNLLIDPRIGLLFIDFKSGGLLHITGHANVEWNAENTADPSALRSIDVKIKSVLYRPQAVSLRWAQQ